MRRKEKTFIAHVLSFMIMGPVTGSEKSLLTLRIRSSAIGDRVVDRSDRYLHAFMFQGEIKKICSRPLIVVVKMRCVYLAARTGGRVKKSKLIRLFYFRVLETYIVDFGDGK